MLGTFVFQVWRGDVLEGGWRVVSAGDQHVAAERGHKHLAASYTTSLVMMRDSWAGYQLSNSHRIQAENNDAA